MNAQIAKEIDEGMKNIEGEPLATRNTELAFAGYDYAIHGGNELLPMMEGEMDLTAFNAGISNANVRHGLNINKLQTVKG
jgi:hypothetical protein